MKIWFRTEAEQGGEQSARRYSSANPTSPNSPRPHQRPVSSDKPAENRAEDCLRRGAACCARFSLSDQRHSLAAVRSPRSPRRPLSLALPTANTADHSLSIAVISNRELLVLENLQLIENKHRQPVLIENFEPNSAPSFRPFSTAALLPTGAKASRAGYPSLEIPRNLFDAQRAV
jgi:hypothetical protein